VSLPSPGALHEMYGRELTELLNAVLAGDLVSDRVNVERRLIRVVAALVWLQQRHRVDEHGRCSICRVTLRAWWRRWPRRSMCTVHTALTFHLRQSDRFVLIAAIDQSRRMSMWGSS
jgi:hypothetical protein